VQLDAVPSTLEYLPAAHNVHAVDPEAVAYLPAGHNVQLALPASEYMPGGHLLAAVAPLVAATTPLRASPLATQVSPPSPDWKMDPPVVDVAAANLLKSGDAVMPCQFRIPSTAILFHVTPLSMDRYMLPLSTGAASLVKSGVEVIPRQLLLSAPIMAVHVTPLSLDM
jgi:hypothetical protein